MEETLKVVMAAVRRDVTSNDSEHNKPGLAGGLPGTGGNLSLMEPFPSPLGPDNLTSSCACNVTTLFSDFQSNVEDQLEHRIATVIWQVCPVILFLFGTFGNVLILLMLRRLRLGRTSMHIYLRALAISDLCVLYTGLLRWWIYWTFDLDLRKQHTSLCKAHVWLVYVSLSVSAWLLVVMTLERTCSACLPHRVNTFCTKRRACMLIGFIVVFHCCIQSHFLFGLTVHNTNGTFVCDAISDEYRYFVHEIWPLVDLCVLSLLPFVCLIIGNAIIVWKTFLSLKTAAELNLTSGTNAMMRRRHASSMTAILLGLSAIFLLTTSPTCVYNMWERGGSALEVGSTAQGKARLELAWAVVNIIMYCNNTFNFYLYCLTGRKFRHEMQRQFSRHRTESHSNVLSAPSAAQLHKFVMSDVKKNGVVQENGQVSVFSPGRLSVRARPSNAFL
ncbi:CX3C chemokine receptor 1-like [Aplysia californica]|uniref:CX3C chemokine receptor 1-like n=1 Tax=Aplysia californica TaxID=6500 RepID=A0ABM0JFC6_APLCA|nr:CX3C chemokine receptor 1-like [Aplysia californica]